MTNRGLTPDLFETMSVARAASYLFVLMDNHRDPPIKDWRSNRLEPWPNRVVRFLDQYAISIPENGAKERYEARERFEGDADTPESGYAALILDPDSSRYAFGLETASTVTRTATRGDGTTISDRSGLGVAIRVNSIPLPAPSSGTSASV